MCYFYAARGVVGWKGSRKLEESPKIQFKDKTMHEIQSHEEWKSHLEKYGTKTENKKESSKIIFIDLAFAVHQKKQPVLQLQKRASNNSTAKNSTPKSKKVKVVPGLRAPEFLAIDVLPPVEFDAKDSTIKTSRTDPLSEVVFDFNDYVGLRYREEDENALNENVNLENGGNSNDENISQITESSSSELNENRKLKKEDDDVVDAHIYEPIRHFLFHKIIEDKEGKFKCYADKIGKKVRFL